MADSSELVTSYPPATKRISRLTCFQEGPGSYPSEGTDVLSVLSLTHSKAGMEYCARYVIPSPHLFCLPDFSVMSTLPYTVRHNLFYTVDPVPNTNGTNQ